MEINSDIQKPNSIPNDTANNNNSDSAENKVDKKQFQENFAVVGTIDRAPDFLRDNEFIFKGYRINFNSFQHIIKSMFICHNESVNVWSHLLGSIMVLLFVIYTTVSIKSQSTLIMDKISLLKNEINLYTGPIFNYEIVSNQNFTDLIENIKEKTFKYYEKVERKILSFEEIFVKLSCNECELFLIETVESFKKSMSHNLKTTKNLISRKFLNIIESNSTLFSLFNWYNSKISDLGKQITSQLNMKEKSWLGILKKTLQDESKLTSRVVKWPIYCFLFGAIFCLSCSSIFHLFSCHCEDIHDVLSRLDYAGISILIAGSCYPPYFYLFYCSSCKFF